MAKYDVFISYSRKDLQQVEPFVKSIEQKTGVKCWIDWSGIESGSQFEEVIVKAIDSVDVVLFFISENSISSDYAKMEVNYAYNTNKKVVPIVLDGKALRGWYLFKFGKVDYIDINNQRQCDKLYRDLQTWCGKTLNTSEKTYKVGDYYNDGTKEGVVFEVSADGRSGKIVSMTQSTNMLKWSSDETEQKRLIGADSETNGAYNMARVKAVSNWQSKYPAFKWCADLGEGWYLPAIEELEKFTLDDATRDAVNRTLVSKGGVKLFNRGELEYYWSSTESDYQTSMFCAWYVYMGDGYTNYGIKYAYISVRAVFAFGSAHTTASTSLSKTYQVGDYYNDGKKEGVVFEVSADGKHGKIMSKSISDKRLQWCLESVCGSIIGTDSELDGAYNMSKIQAIPDWQNKFPAFKWCADLGDEWYMPSRQEMCDICKNAEIKELISPQDDFNYFWSSTEYDKFNAWFIGIKDCYNDNFYKHQLHHIVAVSKF